MQRHVEIVRNEKLTAAARENMFAVFSQYYENVDAVRFHNDLNEKDWVILLRNADQRIVGFSTLQSYGHPSTVGAVHILYSGDTIVDRAYRNTGDLAGAFGHLLLRTIQQHADRPIYWLLTSKGVRTYRFLPVFFNAFAPAYDQSPDVDTKRLIDSVATARFGDDYDPETQIISHHHDRDWLRVAEQDPMVMKRSDPHIQYFLEQNPGSIDGDELVCLTEISHQNLKPSAWRVIEHTKVTWHE